MNGWTVLYSGGIARTVQLGHWQEYDYSRSPCAAGYYLWHPILGGRVRYNGQPFATGEEAEEWNRERLEQRSDLTIADVEAAYSRTRDDGLLGHLRTNPAL
jgi:hypothetical protein